MPISASQALSPKGPQSPKLASAADEQAFKP